MVKVLYKSVINHKNEFPSGFSLFDKITDIIETREYSDLPKTDSIEEFLKRKPKYSFMIYPKRTSVSAVPVHNFIFDTESDARKAYRKCMGLWIDQKLEPYREKVKKGQNLTLDEIDKCEQIQNMLKD